MLTRTQRSNYFGTAQKGMNGGARHEMSQGAIGAGLVARKKIAPANRFNILPLSRYFILYDRLLIRRSKVRILPGAPIKSIIFT